jgi:hypothetical protein
MVVVSIDLLHKLFLANSGLSFKEKDIDIHYLFCDIIGGILFH